MSETPASYSAQRALPLILAVAVLQGWVLYGLHHAIENQHWPATRPGLMLGLYCVTLFVGATLQLLAEHAGARALAVFAAILALAFFYFGYHQGGSVYGGNVVSLTDDPFFPFLFIVLVLWLQILPFLQGRLATGSWSYEYRVLFSKAWRNKLVLAEAALFTALFWILLMLWQQLFHMLGIHYFRDLFSSPAFIYPITTLTFGIALHLIGSIERLTVTILEQLLNVLKWLAVIGALILTLFTVALVFKLPGLVFAGERAIGAAWLLWLVAVMVLLLNAAYRDGSVALPYPGWISNALRWVVPLTTVVSLTALYALIVRLRSYGLTVERFWAFVVAGAALAHSVGYSIAAFGRSGWMRGIARVNVLAALCLMATMALALTPVLSPYRLAADSQARMALTERAMTEETTYTFGRTPFAYLRFDAGRYGVARLEQLAKLEDGPDAPRIRKEAQAVLAVKNESELKSGVDIEEIFSKMVVSPAGRAIDADLRSKLEADSNTIIIELRFGRMKGTKVPVGIFVDLDGDSDEDFVLVTPYDGRLYERSGDTWAAGADILFPPGDEQWQVFLQDVQAGDVHVTTPRWKELEIGRFRLQSRSPVEPARAR